jgi:hypothetical protein
LIQTAHFQKGGKRLSKRNNLLISKKNDMKRNKEISILVAAYSLLILVMFILPFYSTPGYSIIKNTLSQLGAQNTPNAWIMNFTFVSLGIGSIIAGWRYFEGFAFQKLFLILFGISVSLAAFFNHAPVNNLIQYKISEDGWHSYFIFSAGLTFFILTVSSTFIIEKRTDKLVAAAIGVSVIFLSILSSEIAHVPGVWQRLFFIISFGWMIFSFKIRDL